MALENFWWNFSMSAGLFRPRPAVDSPRLDAERIDALLKESDWWLLHGSVKGYEPEDFLFLDEEERRKLNAGIEEYRSVISKARMGGEISEEKIVEAKAGFRRILEVVRPDKYADADAFILGKKVENRVRGVMPGWVREMVFESGLDSSGAAALWVWVEVEDQAINEEGFHDEFSLVSDQLRQAVTEISPELWTYVRLRAVSEQRPGEASRRKARSKHP